MKLTTKFAIFVTALVISVTGFSLIFNALYQTQMLTISLTRLLDLGIFLG